MRKFFLSVVMIFMTATLFAAPVSREEAQKIAIAFYSGHTPFSNPDYSVSGVYTRQENGMVTYYTFLFNAGGFVIVAADDASIPVLGYSFESTMPEEILNPATREWLDAYSKEIYKIVEAGLSNRETLEKWNAIRNGNTDASTFDVNPLTTTTWDQGCYYNAMCPADAGAIWSCGHVYTGCVATAMAQIMKYHNFPPQGVGSHSYVHPLYGVQTADFGNTTYDWASMPNNVTGNNTAVATLMYHAGVSVNMNYGISGSGAYSEDVPDAMLNYFNYHPDIDIQYKNNYSNVEDWKNLLRADLDNSLPIYYSGSGSAGHAFVCDGYRMSDGMFHFNWGWSGSSNGWYAIGALNPGGNTFNNDNAAVLHIKPYNPDLIVRIDHPVNHAVIGVGYSVSIDASTVRGTPNGMEIKIDNTVVATGTGSALNYTWYTTATDLGTHTVYAYSYTTTDTVYYKITLNVAEWISQASGFQTPSRGINYMSAADSNIVWATAFDANNPTGACSDFTRSTDGGTTFTPGTITNTTGLASAMIFAINADKAYVPMYKVSGTKPQGIYATTDGGATWSRQTTASFSNSASFPDCVHFFNENEGWCMGDPINGEFEIYTTTNGGTTWTAAAGSNIPNPVSGEFGIVGYYSAVNDTLWFGTNKGRVYHSTDKGHTWSVSTVPALDGKYIKPTFRTGMHGLVQDKDAGTTGAICESFDGGATWTPVTTTGPIYATDLAYVPGTPNTWVSTGSSGNMGTSYSFDGGHAWADFIGTQGAAYMQQTWVNNHCGWAGGVNTTATENGVYKYIGVLMPPLPPPKNLHAVATDYTVILTWEPPDTISPPLQAMGYNMYRNGTRINTSPITAVTYEDHPVSPGDYTYCVTAIYNLGESGSDCDTVGVAVSTGEKREVSVTVAPNPAHDQLYLNAGVWIINARMFDISGREVRQWVVGGTSKTLDISGLPGGYYTLSLETGQGIITARVLIW